MEPETLVGRCGEGQEFVRGYRKKDGEYVKGFCRKRHERVSRHDREVDRRNLQIATQPQQHTSQMKEAKEQAKEERKAQHEAVVEEKRQEESIDQARERRAQDGKW